MADETDTEVTLVAAVNARGWEKLPIAERDTKFAFRAATDRLAARAGSIEEFSSWFFWRDPRKPANNRNSYRMPFADVFADGTVKLVPSAVYSAAAQLAGAHGALPIIPDAEKEQIRRVIDRIYAKFRDLWEDPRQIPPWERPSYSAADAPVKETETASIGGLEETMPIELIEDETDYTVTAAVNSSGWSDYPIADMSRPWDSGAARQRIKAWAGDDMAKFRKAFLWYDAANAENLTAYKFPIADIIDGRLTIIPRAVNNADARLSSADIPAADKTRIQGILNRIEKRFRGDENRETSRTAAVTAAVVPTHPPAAWFENPNLPGPTRLRVEADGRVYGHIAQWNTCHRGIGNNCVVAPRSVTAYAHFKTGTVLTAEGVLLPVGNLTYGGPHADLSLNSVAAAGHYDNAGTAVAAVNVGEDAHGIWFAGSLAAGATQVEAQQLRTHPLSGDWRLVGSNLELIAALAVNTPGFPIMEPMYAMSAAGVQNSLVAAGVVVEDAVAVDADDWEAVVERAQRIQREGAALRDREDVRRARMIAGTRFQ